LAVVPPSASLVYVGGQNAVNAVGEIVGTDIAAQTAQAMHNVVAALAAGGATLADVFKLSIYLVQGQPLAAAYGAAQPFFPRATPPPTVSVLFVAGLANPAFLIEIEAVAAIAARPAA
jgi:enamine deaminase RidA (YjgF/YER057c/UK114 family)